MKMNLGSLKLQAVIEFCAMLTCGAAIFMFSPTPLTAGEGQTGHGWQRWFKPAQQLSAPVSPGNLRTRLASALDDADHLRGRLSRLREEMLRVRRQAEASRDIILASCLLPHEKRADELFDASTRAYNELLLGLTEDDIGKVSHNLEVFAILENLERQLIGRRDGCQSQGTVVYVEQGPHLPMPPSVRAKTSNRPTIIITQEMNIPDDDRQQAMAQTLKP